MAECCGTCKSNSLVGQKFGMLTVISLDDKRTSDRRYKWVCKCDCGNIKSISGRLLKLGKTKSCGCINKRSYNAKSRLYSIWSKMKQRCNNPKHNAYKNYGGRGIKVCNEWENDFASFEEWSNSNGYEEWLTIERIDVNKGYCPSNCKWIDKNEQSKNTRRNRRITVNGITLTITEWERRNGLSQGTIYHRLKNGWNEEDAVRKTCDCIANRNKLS